MIFFPAVELLDRLAIARIKWRRTKANDVELAYYENQALNLDMNEACNTVMEHLEIIHDTIWELEKELKSGLEQDLSLEEIGRRAIEIRNHNKTRIRCKNLLAELVGCSVREIKKEHLSE